MGALISVNGIDVSDAVIHLPRVGVWHADLDINLNKKTLSGSAEISFGSQTFTGFFFRVGVDVSNRLKARVVGGNGALGTLLNPKGYRSIPLQIPLQDVVTDSGEVGLSLDSDQGILNHQLEAWSRMQVTGGAVITKLLQAVPGVPVWRILPDGTLWVGFDDWESTTIPEATLVDIVPEKGRLSISSSDPVILPGQAYTFTPPGQSTQTQQVSYVRHVITPVGAETLIFYENEPANAF